MTLPSPVLLLWDIDGTLMVSGSAGRRALSAALQSTFGIDDPLDDIDYGGRTDRWILRQILSKFAVPHDEATAERLFANYFRFLPAALSPTTTYALPGVQALIREAHARSQLTQGLLTGNMPQSAEIKMRYNGLWDYFAFGAFGDLHERRNDLGPLALQRATQRSGIPFQPSQTWIIGDTPHDIECGRALGAKTLAVATGSHDIDSLRCHSPTAALGTLADTAAFWRIIDGQ